MQYKLREFIETVDRKDDEGKIAMIPPCAANRDWQEYQAWLADGNEPLAHDEEFE